MRYLTQTITFDSEALSAWGTHIDGAAALIRNRGRENFCTPFACNMFLFIRRNAVSLLPSIEIQASDTTVTDSKSLTNI
jgi:hypothetical protein